ncbi:ABC transporter substrate-binding protein [Microbacterium sp. MMO-10]|uniref:ABC transporter substrate-binding protein n=1 Tax=Microbacterium sp. MMO-10 TaxID=3081272 RepID=UPI0030169304
MQRTPSARGLRLTMAIAVAAAALLAVTACAPRTANGDSTAPPVNADTLISSLPAASKTVDKVTWAVVEGEPATLDPASSANVITPNLCDNLLKLNPDFSVSGGVAEKAEWTDPVTFDIKIRAGLTFWDGTPVTAADVAYSLERNRNPKSQWYASFALIQNIEIADGNTVRVHFSAPDTTFRDALSGAGGAVMSKSFGDKAGDALGTSGVGLMCSGPYQLGAWKPGTEIDVTANTHYWDGTPKTKNISFVFVTDGSTLTTALTGGEIDGAFNVPPGSRDALTGKGAGRLIVGPSTASYSFGPASATSAAANPKIRQALNLAIDRSDYISTVVHGYGYPQKTIVPPFVWACMDAKDVYQKAYDALPEQEVDIAKARTLVAESGADVSKPLVLAIPAGSKELSQTAAIIQSAAKDIGLKVTIDERQPADFGALFFDASARAGVDFVATTGYLETPGVLGYPQLFMLPAEIGGVFNWTNYSNPAVTSNLQAARTATDPKTAAEAFVKAQETFAPDQLQITLAGVYQLTYLSSKLTGVVTSVAMYSSPWALKLGAK